MTFENAMAIELETIPELNEKVYPLVDTKKIAPYAIYQSSYGKRDNSLNGYLDSKRVRVELNIIGNTYEEMKRIQDKVMEKVIGFQQRSIGVEGLYIQEIQCDTPKEIYEPLPKLYRCYIEFMAFFNTN